MTLPTRPLGRTGMDLTAVGFGAWAIGGGYRWGWGEQDDNVSTAAIEATGAGEGPSRPGAES
jgi:aryl-alcohol dehydrogenase-like predicted oxidoreductase